MVSSCEGLMRMEDLVLKQFHLFSESGQLPFTAPALFDTNQLIQSRPSDILVFTLLSSAHFNTAKHMFG